MARNNFGTALGSVLGAVFLAAFLATPVRAQDAVVTDLKAKISAAESVQQSFARGLLHCSELDGKNFYFQSRDRVLNLEDYHRSLASLALQGSFNAETKRPWNQQDADARWAQAQQQALQGQSQLRTRGEPARSAEKAPSLAAASDSHATPRKQVAAPQPLLPAFAAA